jgi:hypothetical protein
MFLVMSFDERWAHSWPAIVHLFSFFCSEVLMFKRLLGGDDDETVIDSTGEDSDRDYVRGLAQRATDPYFKERKAKGPFAVSIDPSIQVYDLSLSAKSVQSDER